MCIKADYFSLIKIKSINDFYYPDFIRTKPFKEKDTL